LATIHRTGSVSDEEDEEAEMRKVSVGVDLHKKQFTVFFRPVEGEGKYARFCTYPIDYRRFIEVLQKYRQQDYEVKVAVESTGNTRYFKNVVEEEGFPVVVINTLKFKVVNESVKKTDRHDAQTIAEFLEKDMLPEARLCSQRSEELRRILKTRQTLVRSIVSIKNQIHGLLLGYGWEIRRRGLNSQKARRQLLVVLEEHEHAGATVKPLLEIIEGLEKQVKELERILLSLVEEDRMVELIRSIPGAGLITAASIRAHIDDIKRFQSYKQLSAYAGLVPRVQCSDTTEHYGRITKRGPERLRTAMVQLVLGMIRSRRAAEFRIVKRYSAMKAQKGSGKSIVAMARKLSKIIWYMLQNDTPFDLFKMTDPHIVQTAAEMIAAADDAA
jgi:transposase